MRKRILSTLLALCLALSLLPASALAAGGEQKSYVALGDSITTGYGLDEAQSFAEQIAEQEGYTLTNLAKDGATSSMLLTSLSDSEVSSAIASADLITITIGGNDLMNALYAYLAEEYNNKQNSDTSITAEDVKESLAGEEGAAVNQITMLGLR